MKRLPRAPRIMGIPLRKETGIDLARDAKDVLTLRFVPNEVKQERRAICQGCEHWNEAANRCTECGCQMRVKTTLSSSRCPLNKWGPHIEVIRE